jgi:hypothetical protein
VQNHLQKKKFVLIHLLNVTNSSKLCVCFLYLVHPNIPLKVLSDSDSCKYKKLLSRETYSLRIPNTNDVMYVHGAYKHAKKIIDNDSQKFDEFHCYMFPLLPRTLTNNTNPYI